VLGVGFEAFWLGWRRDLLWEKWWWGPHQAHNGYLEIYLNLGLIGLLFHVLLILVVISRLLTAVRRDGTAILQLTLLFVVLLHNVTEASFVGVAFLWTIFYLIVFGSSPVLRHGRP
jgi:O-antigen ligase